MDFQDAFARVDKEEEYIVDMLRKVVAVDTTVPPGENYGRLIDIVEPEFNQYGFETQRVVVPEDKVAQIPLDLSGPRENLVARMRNGKPRASAYAHMDVVPIDEPWTRDPFGGEVVDGKMYGRGTVDMKYAIACYLGAVKVLNDLGIEPHYDLECLLCTDEEIGVYPGARYLAEEGWFSPHLIWMELGAIEPIVVTGTAGDVGVRIKTIGKSCHSGMNYLGVNALEEAVPIMQELMSLKKIVEKRQSRIPSFPMPGVPSDKMTPMFNLTIIRSGTKDNIVPGDCTLTVNRRYIVDERYDDVVEEIREAIQKGKANSKLLDVEIEVAHLYPPVEVDPKTPAARKMQQAAKAVMGYDEFIYGGISGSTDLGFVAEILKPAQVEVAACGVIRASNILAHAADEFVYVEDLLSMTKQLVHYMAF